MTAPTIESLLKDISTCTAFLTPPFAEDTAFKTTLHLLWLAVENNPAYTNIQNLLKQPHIPPLLKPLQALTEAIAIKEWTLNQQERVLLTYNHWTVEKQKWFVFLLTSLEDNSKLYHAAVHRLHQQQDQNLTDLKYARLHYKRLMEVFLYEFPEFIDCVIKPHQRYLYTEDLRIFYKQRSQLGLYFNPLDSQLGHSITHAAPEITQTIFSHMAVCPSEETTQQALVKSSNAPNPWPHIMVDLKRHWQNSCLKSARTTLNASFSLEQPTYRHLLLAITHCGELPNEKNTHRLTNCVTQATSQYISQCDEDFDRSVKNLKRGGMLWLICFTIVIAVATAAVICTNPVVFIAFIAVATPFATWTLAETIYYGIKVHLENKTSADAIKTLNDAPKKITTLLPLWKKFVATEKPAINVIPENMGESTAARKKIMVPCT